MGRFEVEAAVGEIEWRQAPWALCALAAWAHYPVLTRGGALVHPGVPDSPAQAALRDLQRRHRDDPPDAVDAHAQAVALLDRLGARGEFEEWREAHKGSGGTWPTSEHEERRRRLTAP